MPKKNIVSIEDRIPNLKQARKKKARRRIVFYVGLFSVLIMLILYLQSPLSQVRQVNVAGNSMLNDETIREWSRITTADNFWSIDNERAAERVNGHPEISSATVSKKFFSTIEINVTEFERVGYLEKAGKYYPVLENGNLLSDKSLKSTNGDAPILSGFKEDKHLTKMATELRELPQDIAGLISEISWQPTEENANKIMLFMNDGYQVEGSIRDFSSNMQVYPSITAQLDPSVEGVIHIGVGAYFEASAAAVEETGTNEEQAVGEEDAGAEMDE